MECPSCRMTLPDGATYCAHCGWRVAGSPVERAVHNVGTVGKEAIEQSLRLLDKTAKAVEPVVDEVARKTNKAIEDTKRGAKPVVDKVKKAADDGAKAARDAVKKGAEATEKAARKVREKVK